MAVLLPAHAQRLCHLPVGFQAHRLQLLGAFGNQLQRQLPRLKALLMSGIFERPLDLLRLLMRIKLTDLFQQLWMGLGKALQRKGLTGFFCNHRAAPLPTQRAGISTG